ncbi:inclusion membrane protein A [Legionella lansingensis]|uniref:Inclusion membrane protein A n=1 Tax=Legionella lansingensis TaxID=45067 RepID=A0A0W0VXH3_9GAMM|nr:LegC2/C7 family Dot/Icm T4SS effector [Legionella lansingensis]KTD24730.1 inclusion membrane protein A [Legionella lansingensis]SNV53596.1 inclusion membrane protein A [Legionella lansingensis]
MPLSEQNTSSEKSISPDKNTSDLPIASNPLDDLTDIALNQKRLGQIKESLGTIVDTMQQNDSLISRAATFWGNLPLWQKIIGGIVLTVPTLAAGLAAHISILLVISGVTVVGYTASGIVLDDHHSCNKNIADRLKKGIFSIADILEITITALDRIRENLAKEIDRFRTQNIKLADTVEELGTKLEMLSNQVEVLVATEELLRKSKKDLETTAEELRKTVLDNDKLLKANQEELTQVKKDYERSKIQLSEKVNELAEVRSSLSLEVQKAKQIAATLTGTVQTLSSTVIEDSSQRKAFQERLDNFLQDEKASFASVAERICNTERELASVKQELVLVKQEFEARNLYYQELLQRQEQQIKRLETIGRQVDVTSEIPKQSSAYKQFGFYAENKGGQEPKLSATENATSGIGI